MKSIVTRWIALVLALVMCIGVLPIGALAEGEEEPEVTDPADPAANVDPEAPAEADGEGESDPSEPAEGGEGEPTRGDVPDQGTTDEEGNDTRVVTDEGLRIEKLYASIHRGAVFNENSDWVWTPVNDKEGHDITYKVTYSFGSTEPFYPGEIEFFIPKNMIKNLNGDYSNTYVMSIPHKDDEGLTETNVYVYEELDDCIRIFNRIEAIPTQKGFFEVSYVTSEKTYEYMDYDYENPQGSEDFDVTMKLTQPGASKEAETSAPPVYIDTAAVITRVDKNYPDFFESWQGGWGPAPENADDYYYLMWEIKSWVNACTQPYDLNINDFITQGTAEPIAYRFQDYLSEVR